MAETIFGKPYSDEAEIRTFDVSRDDAEYVWHKDKENRECEILEGDAAVTQWSQMLSDLKSDFVKSSILNDDGSFKSNDAQEISYALGLGDVVESVQKQMADAPKVSQPQNTPATVKADPDTYVSNVLAARPNTPPATIQAALVAAGVPQAKISQILASMDDDS